VSDLHDAPDHLVALSRARWLRELTEAIAQAQKVARLLVIAEEASSEMRELHARLEGVRVQVDMLRLDGWADVRQPINGSLLESLHAETHWLAAADSSAA
jgi:hypothetical protein